MQSEPWTYTHLVAQSETRSERALSEEPPSSYDEEADMESRGEEEESGQ
jgi:nuclear pore complex protein Nup107